MKLRVRKRARAVEDVTALAAEGRKRALDVRALNGVDAAAVAGGMIYLPEILGMRPWPWIQDLAPTLPDILKSPLSGLNLIAKV